MLGTSQTLRDKHKRRAVAFPTTTTQFFQTTLPTGTRAKQTRREHSAFLCCRTRQGYTTKAWHLWSRDRQMIIKRKASVNSTTTIYSLSMRILSRSQKTRLCISWLKPTALVAYTLRTLLLTWKSQTACLSVRNKRLIRIRWATFQSTIGWRWVDQCLLRRSHWTYI